MDCVNEEEAFMVVTVANQKKVYLVNLTFNNWWGCRAAEEGFGGGTSIKLGTDEGATPEQAGK